MSKKFIFALQLSIFTSAIPRRPRDAVLFNNATRYHTSGTLKGLSSAAGSNGWNVMDFDAVSDCDSLDTDNTVQFQKALDAAASAGGGKVYAPPGCFVFDGELDVAEGVTLSGSWQTVPSHDYKAGESATSGTGTTLLPRNNRDCAPSDSSNSDTGGYCDGPFITLNANAKLQGVTIFYPEQLPNETPHSYPYSVAMVGNNAAVTDVELLNSFNGIWAVQAHRHYIARVQGQPTNVGLFVDQTYDIGRIEDVHWNPWYSMDDAYFTFQCLHGRAFVMGRSDWEYVFNTFAFGYAFGYHFVDTGDGAMNVSRLGQLCTTPIQRSTLHF